MAKRTARITEKVTSPVVELSDFEAQLAECQNLSQVRAMAQRVVAQERTPEMEIAIFRAVSRLLRS